MQNIKGEKMKKKVLVFPCGSEIGLEIHRALKYNKDYELIGGSSVEDHGMFVYELYIDGIPNVDDENFISHINELVEEHNIDYLYPAHDSVVLKFSQFSDMLKAKVVTSNYFTCDICRSKRKTYDYFKDIILVPKMYKKEQIKESDYPLFLKPDVGQGSKGTKKISNSKDLNYFYTDESQLILEYLPYEEYTIDCFTDYLGNLKYCSARKRKRISNGISVSSEYVENPEFFDIANKINDNLKLNGSWFFQLKENVKHELCLLEIAPRIAGTMEFQRSFGVNLPLLNLYNSDKKDVEIIKNKYSCLMDRALETKYKLDYQYEYIYVDLDDVIVQDDKVNYMVLAYLYKSINENKKIILITRHYQDPLLTLKKHNIANIFKEIIHINDKNSLKSEYIKHKNAIFIDDSHKERQDVYKKCNIPVFDVNMIDVLF